MLIKMNDTHFTILVTLTLLVIMGLILNTFFTKTSVLPASDSIYLKTKSILMISIFSSVIVCIILAYFTEIKRWHQDVIK